MEAQTSVLIAQTVVLAITAGILLWYSWETRQLRKGQQWPLVIVTALDNHTITLANMGNSAALNIRVAGYLLQFKDVMKQGYAAGKPLRAADRILHLPPGGSATVHLQTFRRESTGRLISEEFEPEVDLVKERPNLTLRIDFYNVAMKQFFVEQIFVIGSTRLVRSLKRWALFRLFHPACRDLLKIKHTLEGQLDRIQLTPRGQRLQMKPLRP
jgi:hypothetical protein